MVDRAVVLERLDEIRDDLESCYTDLHAHPELSFQEQRTAGEVARRLTEIGVDTTTGVGGTGVVGVLRNGAGPTVLLRADFDALPVEEQTGLAYASTQRGTDPDGNDVPVMHACGHDMHTTCLIGALDVLQHARQHWSGTVVAVFQPAEELGGGARAMVEDGLFERFPKPDVCLGQHVFPFPAGALGWNSGPSMAAADGWRITLFGQGGHGSQPEYTVDPIVLAASVVLRLQTVVSREVSASETAVLTIGSLHAGTKDNIIPGQAEIQVNVRTYDPDVRQRVLAAVERIVHAEAQASGAPREPEITVLHSFPKLTNDEDVSPRVAEAFRGQFGAERVHELPAVNASEDVGVFGAAAAAPTCYWMLGGADAERYAAAQQAGTTRRDIAANHSPAFAPVIEPTLSTGVTALVTAALDRLGTE